MITGEQKQEYLDFSNAILDFDLELSDVKMISELDAQGNVVAVSTFSRCSKYNMEISIASTPRWKASRLFVRECAKYAFVTCGVLRLTIYIAESNKKSIKFSERLGFVREFDGVLKQWFGNEGGIQMVMFKDNCKWIKG